MAKKAAKQRKAKKPVVKAAVRKPAPKPKQPAQRATRRKPMATDPKADTKTTTVNPTVMPPDEALTEQEKDTKAGGSGVGPVAASEPPPPLETMEDLGIGPREPYPSGGAPPPPEADATAKKKGPSK
jgi:hypothetical protein